MKNYLELNKALRDSCSRESEEFQKATANVRAVQNKKLKEIITGNRNTDFGNRFNFHKVMNIGDYRNNVPILNYEDYQEFIFNIMDGKQRVLTTDPVVMLEPTSGSTSPSKFIPYTEKLKKEFQKGIFPWLHDLLTNRPKIMSGSFYWSITPAMHMEEKTSGGIPIGFGDDGIYFTPKQQRLIAELSAVPFDVAKITDISEFKRKTLSHLVSNKDLSFISVWNPTFLSLLVRSVDNPSGIWPNLSLISTWADGNAANYIREIKRIFPNTEIQPKGLIATEAFVSLPLLEYPGSALSINSHFFEFRSLDKPSDVRMADELKKGAEYEVILTTSGGLYRYNLEDVVKVVGFKDQCPLIKFVGRNSKISDLFGEKLNDYHVSKVANEVLKENSLEPSFFMTAPERIGESVAYTLFVESNSPIDSKKLAEEFDLKLQDNYHYKYCRKLGQLVTPKVFLIEKTSDRSASDIYLEENRINGKKIGNVKPAVLSSRLDWSKKFKGRFTI